MSNHDGKQHPEVQALNDRNATEVGRTIWLHVESVSADLDTVIAERRRRNIARRVIELNRMDAEKLRDLLSKRLSDGVPGGISFVLYGREEL